MFFTGSRYIVAGVTLLIAYIAITSQLFVFIPWLKTISSTRMFQVLGPFNLGVAFIYWHYYLACTTEPGSPPPGWGDPKVIAEKKPLDDEKEEGHSTALDTNGSRTAGLKDRSHATTSATSTTTVMKKTRTPLPRYCKNCEGFKPPRSHHCRICKKCVLRMDHHCPWINNCVGHYNYGHFIRFICWVTITTLFCLVLLIVRVLDAIQNETFYMYRRDGPSKVQVIFMVVNILVDGGVLLAVGSLSIYHLWSMMSNTSTIEAWEQEKVEVMIKKGKIRKMLGSGTEFEVMDDKDAALIWPPREYQTSKRQDRTFVSDYTASSMRGHSTGRRNRNLNSLGTPVSVDPSDQIHRGDPRQGPFAPPAQFPTHVRRGSEGWLVQDLTVQQRAELYDRQVEYQRHAEHSQGNQGEEEDEEDYQEGLSDIEDDAFTRLPGGMQGSNHYYYNDNNSANSFNDNNNTNNFIDMNDFNNVQNANQVVYDGGDVVGESEDDQQLSSEYDDLPYDVASDEYDDDGYDDYDDEYHGGDDYFDDQNPYLAYADEDDDIEEDEEDGESIDIEDEVTLHGRDRHKIGRFFENTGAGQGAYEDEFEEGDGIEVGCRPPGLGGKGRGTPSSRSELVYDPSKKTFYTILLEREQALKKQQHQEQEKQQESSE
ncbi:Palmitoyltransferase [Gryganskiella cystojenkinii]|nr:Palmitoyltransferase [Gryganskiella cystojenkinii]